MWPRQDNKKAHSHAPEIKRSPPRARIHGYYDKQKGLLFQEAPFAAPDFSP